MSFILRPSINHARVLTLPIRCKVGKAVPVKLTYELRKKMVDEDDARLRTRIVDSTVEAEHIMKKSDDFSKNDRIMVPEKSDLTKLNGVPLEHQGGRRVRIFVPAKAATQSGTYGGRMWCIEFDNRERWENPLMGWASTGDPLSNVNVEFETAEAAKEFCDRQGWPCYIEAPKPTKMHIQSYGANFSWDKRTRRGTK